MKNSKKRLLISLTLLFLSISFFAQKDGSDDEWISKFDPSVFNNFPHIETEYNFVGNIGITRPNPKRDLHIQGTIPLQIPINNYPSNKLNAAGIRIDFVQSNSTPNVEVPYPNHPIIPSFTDVTVLSSWDLLAKTNRFSIDNINGGETQEFFTITKEGNVGIGTNAPSSKLEVYNGDIVVGGSPKKFIFHTKFWDSNSDRLIIAPDNGSGSYDWAKSTVFHDNGNVEISNDLFVGGLTGTGNRLVLTNGNGKLFSAPIPTPSSGDNLGNHQATQTLKLGGHNLEFNTAVSMFPFGFSIKTFSDLEANEMFANAFTLFSDRSLKTEIKELSRASNLLSDINIYSYKFNRKKFSSMNLLDGQRYGVMAQELQNQFPQFISKRRIPEQYDEKGNVSIGETEILAVNYMEFIPLLIKANNEQQEEINTLKSEIDELKAIIFDSKESKDGRQETKEKGEFSTIGKLISNTPNPFTNTTVINYMVSKDARNAKIRIFNMSGQELSSFDIIPKGYGKLEFDGQDLNAGVYIYLLSIDGQDVDSKTMMIAK